MTVRKSSAPVIYDDRTCNEKLVDLFTELVKTIQSRSGDVDTEDGTFATVDLNSLLNLEKEFESTFGRSIEEVVNFSQIRWLVENNITNRGRL